MRRFRTFPRERGGDAVGCSTVDADYSSLAQMRFERSVPAAENTFEIVLSSYSGVSVPARNNNSTERDQRFESGFL